MKHLPLLAICIVFLGFIPRSVSLDPHPGWKDGELHGRYTRNIRHYEVVIPRKVNHDGAFMSYLLPHFYEHDNSNRGRRSPPEESQKVHYDLTFNDKNHHVEMWPNHGFISPGMMIEERGSGAALDVKKVKVRPVNSTQCHYTGRVRGHEGSHLALSACDGLSGYITTNQGQYFIEPLEGHRPQEDGQHLHVVYQRSATGERTCGTEDWEQGWRERLRWEYRQRRNAHTDARARRTRTTVSSKERYMEILVVADKKFLDYHNNTDVETYILTVMNMAAGFYHDASAGNLLHFVVVHIIYLHKQEEELDLIINEDAEETLKSFCKWQTSVNPSDVAHPNHHDIAVLLTRYDICADKKSDCGLLGLANVAEACNPDRSCAICEDSGLVLGVTVTHEVGHVMGCGHDDGVESACQPQPDEYYAYVMSPYVQMATLNWSVCSKKFMQEFLDNDLGECLLDEPQDHNFKIPEMPPGAMYDANYQCTQEFQNPNATACDMGPDKTVRHFTARTSPRSAGRTATHRPTGRTAPPTCGAITRSACR